MLPVYILDDETPGAWRMGAAQRWWLHHSLASLGADLARLGAPLLLLRGRADVVLATLAAEVGATSVQAMRHFEPWAVEQQIRLAERIDLVLHEGLTLAPPGSVRTGSGGRYRVFTPFWQALQERMPPPPPAPAPGALDGITRAGDRLDDWKLLPTRPDWARRFHRHWQPGEAGGKAALQRFASIAAGYAEGRNLPGDARTSRLSPHLHFGEVSPAQVWHAVGRRSFAYLRELGWRDFAYGLIDQFPDFPDAAHRPEFERMPWLDTRSGEGRALLMAWQRGRTGYPIVDAGMRELWRTGWMHNRVRMIVASFLIKHLMIDWREGERWFWDTLVDADLANNAAGWQWSAGSGVDAAPYFRIFAPVSQSEKFDPAGDYIRRFVPELAQLPPGAIHAPWTAPPLVLEAARVTLGTTYPRPIVEHAAARARALAAYAAIRDGR